MPPLNDLANIPAFSFLSSGVLLAILILLLALATVLKGFALWHAARNRQVFWFIAMLVLNTLGILELVYLIAFRKDRRAVAPAAEAA